MLPVIGIIARKEKEKLFNQVVLHQEYIDVIIKFGGNPLLIFQGSILDAKEKKRIKKWLDKCDGIVITGGYHPTELDYFVLEYALNKKLAIFGICLGMQVMATYKNEDKLTLIGNKIHNQPGVDYVHSVYVQENSNLFKYIGSKFRVKVNSRHLEQVKNGGIFQVVSNSEDGIIEGIESKNHSFQIGVQWHPESMISYDDSSVKLWKNFIEACKKNRL